MAGKERGHDLIVIGGSAGSLEALRKLVAALPGNLPAAILVVVHIPNDFPSYLQQILRDSGSLRTIEPKEKQKLERGAIYVAPPDRHLLVEDGYVEVSRGPRENRHRPAIDPLFRSAARWHGRRVIGVVLSGQLDDGSSGLMAVKIAGGLTVVQDTSEALCPEMPSRAKQYAGAEYELPVAKIAELLALLRRIGARTGDRQAASYNEEAGGYDKHAETIRELLVQNQGVQMREESKAESA